MRFFSSREYGGSTHAGCVVVTPQSAGRTQPRVGQLHFALWAPFIPVAVASYGISKAMEMRFGEDTRAYLNHVNDSITAFFEDVVRDICTYGSVRVSDAAKSDSNPYGVLGPETVGYPGWDHSVCKKRGGGEFELPPAPGQKPHIQSDWFTAFNWWMQDWNSYYRENLVDFAGFRPDRAQIDTWYAQLEADGGWRKQFLAKGGKTITPVAPEPVKPTPIPWVPILVVGGIIAAALLIRSLPIPR